MKKNETLKWDFHRIYFWLFCFALAVIILACSSGIQFVQGQECTKHSECATDEKCCNGECINVQTDMNNCGGCKNICTGGYECISGVCKFIDPKIVCANTDCGSVEYNGNTYDCGDCPEIVSTKAGCLICESGVCIDNPRNDPNFVCDPINNECRKSGLTCRNPCLVCEEGICSKNKGIIGGGSCKSEQNQCEEEGKACVSKEKDTAPQTLTIDIARFVRNTVAFADLGSMAGTWLDKTLGISFFSTPFWGKLEKTWPEGAQIFGGNWESSFCRKLWCVNLDSSGISGAKGAIGSHIEGEKLKISPELNLYKITFALNPTTESLTKQMNFTIELYDNSGNKEYLDLNNDKKPDTWINIKNKYATSKTNPIAFYSKKDYQKICLRFFNTNDYIKELRFALISNSNQLCNNFFDGDPSQNNMNINFGEIEFGGEVNGCANC
ncbi:MAG TPA: hypothetical protein PLX15_03835 [Candidatus Woesearchaeota archaeon]|nr:hypothetical protein [Candidatus Woesearchaeota archaeon]